MALLPNELLVVVLQHLDSVALASMLQTAAHMRHLALHVVRLGAESALQEVTTQCCARSATHPLLTEGVLNTALRVAARTGDGVLVYCLLQCGSSRHLRVKLGALVQISRCSGHMQLSQWLRLRLPRLSVE